MSLLAPNIVSGKDWRGLEKAVARLMSHTGWHNVKMVGESGDEGADILSTGTPKTPRRKLVVQVKAVTSGYVDTKAVDEVLNAMIRYAAHTGVLATNGSFRNTALERVEELQKQGFTIKLWNGAFLETLASRAPLNHAWKRDPREYQKPIVERLISKIGGGASKLNFVLATGLGKSLVAAETARQLWDSLGFRRILVLCHMKDLTDQLEISFWPQLSKDIPTWSFYGGKDPILEDGINFGLFQTLSNKLDQIEPGSFDAIFVDEAHHASAASYRNCLDHLAPKVLIGMTATPWHRVAGSFDEIFGERVAQISLPEGMRMGYLAKVKYAVHCDNINWDELPKIAGKPISVRNLNKKLFIPQRDEAVIQEILKAASTLSAPRICVFCPSIEHGKRFAKMLSSQGISARELSGVNKIERWKSLMDFGSGMVTAVTAVDVLNEGIDVPDVNIVVFMRVTHSHRIFIQQLGRGLRISENKSEVVVLDFVTDIRRIADLIQLDRAYKGDNAGLLEDIRLDDEIKFTNPKVRSFMEQWMEDLSGVADTQEEDLLQFPELKDYAQT